MPSSRTPITSPVNGSGVDALGDRQAGDEVTLA